MAHTFKPLLHGAAALGAGLAAITLSSIAQAVPVLQVYGEGATYNETTESWDINATGSTVEVIVAADLSSGPVENVNMVFAYGASNTEAAISVVGLDGSAYGAGAVNVGSTPDPLSKHGIYGSDTAWVQYNLGTFDTASQDYSVDYPEGTINPNAPADVRTYRVTLTNVTGTVHIDAFGTINGNTVVFAPYSHDADVAPADVPELPVNGSKPAVALLLGAAALMLSSRRRKLAP